MTSDPLAEARQRVQRLCDALAAAHGGEARLIETHISWVLLAGSEAWKLKKPVQLPFLDFRSLQARRHFCGEELRLNRRLAPGLYIGVVDIREDATGPHFGGEGAMVDAAVHMHRFADGALWSEHLAAGTLEPRHIDAMARRLAAAHAGAAPVPAASPCGSAESQQRVTGQLAQAVEGALPALCASAAWTELRAWLEDAARALAPAWDSRRRLGRVRECHGDLHLANVIQLGEEPMAFDAIEFDPALQWIDVADDAAFLAMDLAAHGRPALAHRFIDGWLESTGDHEAVAVLRFFMVRRALVRLMVRAMAPAPAAPGPDYLSAALRFARGGARGLAITHGLPGSGKSFVSQGLLEECGAIRLRSDVERKRLFGLAALQSSSQVPGGIYDASTTRRTYERLEEAARIALAAGWPVIVDAAFLRRDERSRFAALARRMGVPFSIIDCRATMALLRQRIEQRRLAGADASEADEAVLERLAGVAEPLDDDERDAAITVDATRPLDASELARRWAQRMCT